MSKDFVQEIIHAALNDQLGGKVYDANKVSQWSKNIADNVKSQVKTLGYDRYKIVVEVVIGEQVSNKVNVFVKGMAMCQFLAMRCHGDRVIPSRDSRFLFFNSRRP